VPSEAEIAAMEAQQAAEAAAMNLHFEHEQLTGLPEDAHVPMESDEQLPAAKASANPYANQYVGRNDPCPCGSGKKYKQCHGQLA
jgi:preprotein translocase subunit SecA